MHRSLQPPCTFVLQILCHASTKTGSLNLLSSDYSTIFCISQAAFLLFKSCSRFSLSSALWLNSPIYILYVIIFLNFPSPSISLADWSLVTASCLSHSMPPVRAESSTVSLPPRERRLGKQRAKAIKLGLPPLVSTKSPTKKTRKDAQKSAPTLASTRVRRAGAMDVAYLNRPDGFHIKRVVRRPPTPRPAPPVPYLSGQDGKTYESINMNIANYFANVRHSTLRCRIRYNRCDNA